MLSFLRLQLHRIIDNRILHGMSDKLQVCNKALCKFSVQKYGVAKNVN